MKQHFWKVYLDADQPNKGGGGGEDKRTEAELLEKIQSKIDTALATRATKDELKAIKDSMKEEFKDVELIELRKMADAKDGVMVKLAAQGIELQRLQTRLDRQPEDLSVRSQVANWYEQNKTNITAIKNGTRQELAPLELRVVASPMSVVNVNAGSSPYIGRFQEEPGVNSLVRPMPVFWDFVVKGRTNSPTYTWVNKTTTQGAAAFIGPGVLKPGISFGLVAEISTAKKIADSAKATTELLDDIDGMVTFIEQELKYQVMIKVNQQLMTGTASSTNPAGIQTISTTYTLTTIKTTSPNYMDCVRAVIGQLRSGWLQGEITVFVNSVDMANMDLSKATTAGVYLMPSFVTADGMTIAGARVIEDNNVPIGYIQAGFMRFYRILIYKDFTVTWGWENDDFTRNLVTAVGEMRLHQFFNSVNTGAFIYDSFANVKAAITAP